MMSKITVAYLRNLEKQVHLGEISYSKMVELLNQKAASLEKGDPPYVKIGLQNSDWTEEQDNKVREYVSRRNSPVSQQLTRDKMLELLEGYGKPLRGFHIPEEWVNPFIEAVLKLSVRPDDETPLQVYKRNLKLQNEISELKEKIKIIVDESNIVAEKLSEATSFANEQANKAHEYSMKLTSKESDVKNLHLELSAVHKALKLTSDGAQLLTDVINNKGGQEKIDLAGLNFDNALDLITPYRNNY